MQRLYSNINKNASSLVNNRDFSKVYTRGKSVISKELITYFLPNKNKGIRIGITTSKKIGNAVKRNRARRLIKEAIKENLKKVSSNNFDIVFVARTKTSFVKSFVLQKCIKEHFRKLNIS